MEGFIKFKDTISGLDRLSSSKRDAIAAALLSKDAGLMHVGYLILGGDEVLHVSEDRWGREIMSWPLVGSDTSSSTLKINREWWPVAKRFVSMVQYARAHRVMNALEILTNMLASVVGGG